MREQYKVLILKDRHLNAFLDSVLETNGLNGEFVRKLIMGMPTITWSFRDNVHWQSVQTVKHLWCFICQGRMWRWMHEQRPRCRKYKRRHFRTRSKF